MKASYFGILVQSETVNDLIQFGVHYNEYFMVHFFGLVSLTLSYRNTSYRSLKRTAGSTSCPWTTILVYNAAMYPKDVNAASNIVDPDQTEPSNLDVHRLLKTICPNAQIF